MKIRYMFIFLLMFFINCKEEFIINTNNVEPLIVIDGLITDQEGPYTVRISKTSPVNEAKLIPYENCIVSIYENDLESEILTEVEPGIYKTSENGIRGKVGSTYHITISTPDNNQYVSEYQQIPDHIGIDSVYTKEEFRKIKDYPFDLPGYQFYIDTEKANTHESYFMWKLIETYEYTVDYMLYARFDGQFHYDVRDQDKYFRCWRTEKINKIFTASTSNLNILQIKEQPLNFVGTDTKRLQVKYSILLMQYCLNKEAFIYWKKCGEMFGGDNFLISVQPYNIEGNIKNTNDPNELVLGFFTAASTTHKRIFVNPLENLYYEICALGDLERDLQTWEPENPDILIVYINGIEYSVYEGCVDCRRIGSSIIEPEFWDE